jgi:hypothetical protein
MHLTARTGAGRLLRSEGQVGHEPASDQVYGVPATLPDQLVNDGDSRSLLATPACSDLRRATSLMRAALSTDHEARDGYAATWDLCVSLGFQPVPGKRPAIGSQRSAPSY